MDDIAMNARLDGIESRLDAIFQEIELQRARRRETEDLKDDLTRVGKDLFHTVVEELDEFDRKGYIGFLKEIGKVADNVVTSFTVDDVRNLGENIVTIMNTVKSMTQPDVLHAINNALNMYKKMDLEVEENVSLLALLKEMNTPEARRGLAFAVRLMKSIASQDERYRTHEQGEHS